jgi:hypothetical protein
MTKRLRISDNKSSVSRLPEGDEAGFEISMSQPIFCDGTIGL